MPTIENKPCVRFCSDHKYHCAKCYRALTYSPANLCSRPQDIPNYCRVCFKPPEKHTNINFDKKCDDCYALYTGKHTCDGLMKMLVSKHKEKETTANANEISSKLAVGDMELAYCNKCIQMTNHNGATCLKCPAKEGLGSSKLTSKVRLNSSKEDWREDFHNKFDSLRTKKDTQLGDNPVLMGFLTTYISHLLESERREMVDGIEKMRKPDTKEHILATYGEGHLEFNRAIDSVIALMNSKK